MNLPGERRGWVAAAAAKCSDNAPRFYSKLARTRRVGANPTVYQQQADRNAR